MKVLKFGLSIAGFAGLPIPSAKGAIEALGEKIDQDAVSTFMNSCLELAAEQKGSNYDADGDDAFDPDLKDTVEYLADTLESSQDTFPVQITEDTAKMKRQKEAYR